MLRSSLSRAFYAAIVLAAATPAAAQSAPSPSPSPQPLTEIGRVQTSDRSIETVTSAARTTYVVTKEQMQRNGYRNVGDAIAALPGVQIAHLAAVGGVISYGVRGMSSTQVLVLVDGIPAPGSFSGSVNLASLSTSGVQRIEVVEGGGSTLYGQGSMGGIINVITQGRRPKAGADVRLGSFGDRALRFEAGGFSYERIVAGNGYPLPGGSARENSDYEATSLHAGFDAKIGSFDAALRAGSTGGHLGADGPLGFTSPTSRENDLNQFASLRLSRRARQSVVTAEFGGSLQTIAFGCHADPKADPNCFQPAVAVSHESAVSFNVRNEVDGAANRTLYGIDVSRGVVRSDSGGTSTPGISFNALAHSAAYVQETSFFRRGGRIYAGIRAERDGALGGEFSPSAGFIIPLSTAFSVKGNVASAFRAPSASELYFPGYGNPALHAERAKVADLSLNASRLLGGATLGWFTNRTSNLIVPVLVDPVNFIYAPENIDHALVDGLTLDIRTQAVHHISAAFNLTDLYRADDLEAKMRLPRDAVFTTNLALQYAGTPTAAVESAGISVHSTGARGRVDLERPGFDQPVAYSNVSAFVRFNIAASLRLSLRGDNLGNERFAEVAGFPVPGRTFAVELSAR
ncbi:MAG: TonB-dependent receptor [Candidatus Eremiobacteraeota bacterium]|nr:TonB-dependent receptor [Candidatus Eremiobacteraeota bacterium]